MRIGLVILILDLYDTIRYDTIPMEKWASGTLVVRKTFLEEYSAIREVY